MSILADCFINIELYFFFPWMAEKVFKEMLMAYPIPLHSITACAGTTSITSPLIYSIIFSDKL